MSVITFVLSSSLKCSFLLAVMFTFETITLKIKVKQSFTLSICDHIHITLSCFFKIPVLLEDLFLVKHYFDDL